MNKRIIFYGDTHGRNNDFYKLAEEGNYDALIHLGDFGFDESWIEFADKNLPNVFILPGNHDDYDTIRRLKSTQKINVLGNYGILEVADKTIFYVRGASSIDKDLRIPGLSWWADEEFGLYEGEKAFQTFNLLSKEIDIVISHCAPARVGYELIENREGNFYVPSFTESLLERFLEVPVNPIWFFGHYHTHTTLNIGKSINLGTKVLTINQTFNSLGIDRSVTYHWE